MVVRASMAMDMGMDIIIAMLAMVKANMGGMVTTTTITPKTREL